MFIDIEQGHINKLPFRGLEKKSDLFKFEYTPVLTHYFDVRGNDYLFYCVDFQDDENRWLCIRVSKDNLFYYLNDGITLRELIFIKEDNPYLFIVNENNEGVFVDGFITMPEDIPTDYLPDESSYFEYDFPKLYRDYFPELDYVTKEMRRKALYIGIESKTTQYGTTIDTNDMVELIEKTEKSFMEYSKDDFYATYRNQYTEDKLDEIYIAIKAHAKLRMCNVEYGSFKIALCSDVMNDTIDPKFLDWKQRIVLSFKNDVIDSDFTSEEDAKRIELRFPDPLIRERIFAPLISLIENKNFNLIVSNQAKTKHKTLTIGKKSKEIILPKKTLAKVEAEKFPEMDIIQTYMAVPKGKNLLSKPITPKKLQEMTLFSQITNNFPIIFDNIGTGNSAIELYKPLELFATYKNGQYELIYKPLEIIVHGTNRDELNHHFIYLFTYKYINNKNETDPLYYEFRKLVKTNQMSNDDLS